MSRTTGYPIAILSLLVAKKQIDKKGVVPLEILGQDENASSMILRELKERKIIIQEQIGSSA
jgi:saccharopine dehydrogenase-like NADP-dependent oxidoreductase